MKYSKFLLIVTLMVSLTSVAQSKRKPGLNLTNAVVVGQMDDQADRYSIEVNLTEMLTDQGIKAVPSLNLVKIGQDSRDLAEDSLTNVVKNKNMDTYCLVTVRGYDKRFKTTENQDSLAVALEQGNLFSLYQMDIISVSFEFKFYREGEFIYSDIVRIGSIGDRDAVLKKFRRKVVKRIKAWKN